MRVCFLVPDVSRSGGIDVIQDHARRLEHEHGAEVAVAPVSPGPALDAVRGDTWDVALATWWTTIPFLHELRATRRGVLAQGFDPLHYRSGEFVDRLAATAAIAAPFDLIAVSEWVCEMARAVRPTARCSVVRPGIDKAVFGGEPRRLAEGPLRILIEGQPTVWFKGVSEALEATAAMRRAPHVTLVALDPGNATRLPVDRVVGGLDAAAMAGLYREVDVVLKLSRFEGLGLAPLEAFHAGVPCVVTPYGGHAEYVTHGENGLVVGFDDIPATARALDRLDEDRGLLATLSEGALRTAEAWPDREASTAMLHEAMSTLSAGNEEAAMLHTVLRQTASGRVELRRLHGVVGDLERSVEHEHGRAIELGRSADELSALLEERAAELEHAQAQVHALGMQLEETKASRAYRAAIALRSLLPGRR